MASVAVMGGGVPPPSGILLACMQHGGVAEATIADADALGLWSGKVMTKISEVGSFGEAEAEDQH